MACVDAAPWCAYAAARLLAFLYVAACFSMESAEQDAAIWALSTEFTMGHMSNLLSETKTMLDLEEESRAVLQAHFSGRQSSTCVMLVEPQRMNARLAVQQGCFVVPGDLSKSFMENLAHCLEVDVSVLAVKRARSMRCGDADRLSDTPVVKIVLPKEIHNQAVWDLDQMNVNATSFFPGLDGFARSLHTCFEMSFNIYAPGSSSKEAIGRTMTRCPTSACRLDSEYVKLLRRTYEDTRGKPFLNYYRSYPRFLSALSAIHEHKKEPALGVGYQDRS
jgi:hypothetical protein